MEDVGESLRVEMNTPLPPELECPQCHGTGEIEQELDDHMWLDTCALCGGAGIGFLVNEKWTREADLEAALAGAAK
jgi:hypothetical protein